MAALGLDRPHRLACRMDELLAKTPGGLEDGLHAGALEHAVDLAPLDHLNAEARVLRSTR